MENQEGRRDLADVAAQLAPVLAQLAWLLDDPHVTRVAERSGVSQPTLSRSIVRWEQALGLRLVERRGRAIALTEDGRAVATAAADALAHLEDGLTGVLGARRPRTLAVGFMRSLGPTVVGELVAAFHAAQPEVLVTHREGAIGALLDDLVAGTLDLAVVAPRPDSRFDWFPLGRQALALVVPPHHRLADRGPVDLAEARDETFLALDGRFATRTQADRLCAAAGFTPRIGLEADDAATVRDYVAAGFGIAVLPVDTGVNPRVRSVAIASPGAVREVGIATLRDRRPGAPAQAFHDIARRMHEEYPGWADLLVD